MNEYVSVTTWRPQSVNSSASFRFLLRLSVIFGFRRDLLLPARTVVLDRFDMPSLSA